MFIVLLKDTMNSGDLLEKYKQWFLKQPKLLQVAILPCFIGVLTILLTVNLFGGWVNIPFLLVSIALLAWHSYNNYLLAISIASIDEIIIKRDWWKNKFIGIAHLNNTLKELVQDKSELYIKTVLIAEDEKAEAIKHIRSQNAFKTNVQRIISSMYKVFLRFADTAVGQQFRIAFLVPTENRQCLTCRSWDNPNRTQPKSLGKDPTCFTKDGKTLAGYIWRRDQPYKIIDNTEEHVATEGEDRIFDFLHDEQRHHIKSILCYNVREPQDNKSLGIICIDSNVNNVFEANKIFFLEVLDSFAKRIVFEARNAAMMEKLMRPEGNAHV